MKPIRIKVLNKKATPVVGKQGDAGIDLRASIQTAAGYTVLEPGEEIVIGLGIEVEVPEGWVGLLMPRSGVGGNYEVKLKNTIGVIDSNFRGEVIAKLRNGYFKQWIFEDYERICQLVIVPHYLVYDNLEFVDELSETERGASGFGDSGRM